MRRFAGRFAALVLALLMLLSSMPLTALAEQVVPSKSFDIDVSTTGVEPAPATSKTAAELAQEAVNAAAKGNQDGAYLNIYSAAPPSKAVETGLPFDYTIGMQFGAAPTYTDPVSGAQQAAYTKYENVKITVTAPNHIELIKDDQRAQSFTYELSDDGEPGSSKTLSVRARMTNNGVAEAGFDYGALEVKIEAEITSVFGGDPVKIEYTFETGHEKNTSGDVTNTATAEWRVTKTMPETGAFVENEDDTVTVTWNIAVSRTDDKCNTTGTLNFAENGFTLTDTLPQINGHDPISAKLTSTDGGITVSQMSGEPGAKTISTTYYATTDLTDNASNNSTSITPTATTYTVTAVYPRDAFVLPWNVTKEISVENTATLNYTLVGETATPPVDSKASGEYGIETPGGSLTIVEKLNIAGTKEVPYSSYYAQLFTQPNGGVQFKVYRQNEETEDYELVQIGSKDTVAVTVGADGASVTLTNLEPGNYRIEQTTMPNGSTLPQDVTIYTQNVPIQSDGSETLTFINPTPAKRILTIEKRDSAGNLIAIKDESKRAQFEVKVESDDVNEDYPVTVNADGQYVLAINVSSTADTTVTIKETRAPDGYIKSTQTVTHIFKPTDGENELEKTFTFTNHKTVTGTLTINKNVANYDGVTGTAISGISDYSFTFNVYQSTDEDNISTEGQPHETATLTSGSSIQITGLEVADENGNPYYYKVVEEQGNDSRFVYDDAEPTFNFVNAEGGFTTTASVTFTNVLKGKLQVTKVWQSYDPDETRPAISFALYTKSDTGYTEVKDANFTANGNVYTTPYLPVADANGEKIDYYLKEIAVDGYTPSYSGATNADGYYGPITLTGGNTVDVAVTNTKNEGELIVKKTDSTGKVLLKGATFTVSVSEDALTDDQATALTALDFTLKGENYEASLTTGDNGTASIEGLPLDVAFTVTETVVPDGYIISGKYTVDGVDRPYTSEEDAKATVTLETPQASKTVTFKNDKNPTLTVTKEVNDTPQTGNKFTFTLYTKDGENAYTPVKNADETDFTFTDGQTITLEVGKVYAVKETGFPAGVVAPAEGNLTFVNEENATQANRNYTLTIDNTSSYATLTLKKQDSKTQEFLTGAKVEIKVTNENLTEEDEALLVAAGFKDANGDFAATQTVTIDNASGKSVSLPAFLRNGKMVVYYTIQETEAPTGYLLDETLESVDITLVGEGDAASQPTDKEHTFTNAPEATLTVTKTYYKQWEAETNNQRLYTLDGAVLALFELDGSGDSATLKQVGQTVTTSEGGKATFAGLDGTKTYYVFELSNTEGFVPENDKKLADNVSNIQGETLSKVAEYYYVTADLMNDQNEVAMTNVETYVQLTLDKYYMDKVTDLETGEEREEKTELNRAKFYLYRSTNEGAVQQAMNSMAPGTPVDKVLEKFDSVGKRVDDYVYESGIGYEDGMVVTKALEGTNEAGDTYYYWLVEYEAPSGFKEPVAPCWSDIVSYNSESKGGELQNFELPKGEGTIRYFQIVVDKVAMKKDENGEWDENTSQDLADATFTLYLKDGEAWEKLTFFTTGVDKTGLGANYDQGRGVSESLEMRKLLDQYGPDAIEYNEETGEYTATFKLVETSWPGNTTPVQPEHIFELTTNDSTYDRLDGDATLWMQFADGDGFDGPIINEKAEKVTVYFEKFGYDISDPNNKWPLSGAGITIYTDENMTKPALPEGTTDDNGRVYFTLDPNTQYWWKETTVPDGYEKVGTTSGAFETQGYSSTITEAAGYTLVAQIDNLKARTVTITKETNDASVESVTLRITKSGDDTFYADNLADNASGTEAAYFDLEIAIDPATRTGEVKLDLLSGTYLIEETKINGAETTSVQKKNFALINGSTRTDNKVSFVLTQSDISKDVPLENPGTGSLTIHKVDDSAAKKELEGVKFTLSYKQFTSATDATGETAPTFGYGNLPGENEVTILTTDEDGSVSKTGLVPGWYELVETVTVENHVLDATPKYFKIPLENIQAVSFTDEAAIVNARMAQLTITKSFVSGAEWPEDGVTIEVKQGTTVKATVELSQFEPQKTIHLPAGTYTVEETTAGDWYTKYTVTKDGTDGTTNEIVTDEWNTSATVTLVPDNADTPVTVAFTNVGNRASLTAYKEDENGTALVGAEFVLYYTANGTNYYYATNDTWVLGETAAGKYTSKLVKIADKTLGVISIPNIKLPDAMFTEEGATITTDEGELFYLKEVKAPDGYTIDPDAQPKQVILVAGKHDSVISEAFVNNIAIDITLTKYGKPQGVAGETDYLKDAGFTLYTQNADGTFTPVAGQAVDGLTNRVGALSFTNLEKLGADENYYLRETITPETHVAGETEVYLNGKRIESETVNGNKYFPIPGNANADLKVYNTPKSQIVVLKYDYVDKTSLPIGAIFEVEGGITSFGPTGMADDSAPSTLSDGTTTYTKGDDGYYYSHNGTIRYSVTFSGLVDPETYIVTEKEPATGYLNIISGEDEVLQKSRSVTVGNTGEPAVVVFANVPDPDALGVTITKSVAPTTLDSLQTKDGQDITYTIGGFTALPLAVNSAVVTDEGLTFAPAGSAATVDWEITELTIGRATYDATNPFYADVTTKVKVECKVNNVNGEWQLVGNYTVATSEAKVNSIPDGAQGIRLTYFVEGRETLPGGFKPGDVTVKIHVSQPTENKEVVPVEKIKNLATYVVKYDFVSSTGEDEAIAQDEADATAVIESEVTLPEATLTKELQDASGKVPTDISPKDKVKYVITLNVTKNGTRNGDEEWGMTNPVIVDEIPSQLEITSATYSVAGGAAQSITPDGQIIRVNYTGELMQGEQITVEVNCTVLDIAALVASIQNTAYAYSDYVLPLTSSNQEGASFKKSDADEYEYPSIVIPDELVLGGKKGINDQATANVAKTQGVSINKFVTAGSETVGGSGYITVQAGGAFTYTVNVTNQSDQPITNVWIADQLPILNDGRISRWSPTLDGEVTVRGEAASVYYSTDSTDGTIVLQSNYDAGTPSSKFTLTHTGARTILVIVPEIAANSTVTVIIPCTAPSGEDANSAYYYMAVNNAQMRYAGGPPTPDSSSVTNVTLMPPMVSIGDKVWIDENYDGVQDEAEKRTAPQVTFTLQPYDGDAALQSTRTTSQNGEYKFEDIYPAAPTGESADYHKNGDVDYTSLVGLARYTYRLSATVPTGYRLTTQYAQNSGRVPTVDGSATRKNDSNFGSTGTGNTVQTERFYVPAGPGDMTYDLGLVRERNLTIEKKGDNGLNITAKFNVYGPYNVVPPSISADDLVATITTNTQGGSTTVYKQGGPGYLNAYQYYVVVESDVVTDHYSTERFDVLPGTGTNVVADATVSGVAEGEKYFVLGPDDGTDMEGAVEDKVTVTNDYIAEGKLIITGTKAVDGVLAEDTTFTFTLTGEEGAPMPSEKTKTAKVAKGETSKTFAFPAITYTYDDVDALGPSGRAYVYKLKETVSDPASGIVYDQTEYTIQVTMADTNGDGVINVYADVYIGDVKLNDTRYQSDEGTLILPADTMTFTNRVEGGFSVKKVEKGNAASSDDINSFEFTLTLTGGNDDFTYASKTNGVADTTPVSVEPVEGKDGAYTFSLVNGQEITFSGLLVGTEYTVTEKDYKSDGYVTAITIDDTASEAASRTITAAGNPQIVFTNTRDVGNLAVSKTVAGTDWDGPFNFNLTLTNAAGLKLDGTYTVTGIEGMQSLVVTPGETTDDGTTTGTASFQLKDGDAITIYGIPAGTAFIVTEQAPTGEPSYDALGYVTAAIVAQNYIEAGKTATVAFTNTRYAGDLKVTKAVDEATFTNPNAQADQAYSITVTLTPPEGKIVGGRYTVYTLNAEGEPVASNAATIPSTTGEKTITVSLKANEYVLFEDLLKDTRYTVTENVTDALIQAGFVVPTVADSGNGEITMAQSDVTVTNDIPVGSLSVSKTVTGDDVETDREFQFTLTMTGANMGNGVIADVDGTYNVSGIAGFTALRVENGTATFKLKHGQTITIEGIREGTVCTVEEDDYRAYGYTTTCAPSNNSATIRATTSQTITVTNDREVVDLRIEKEVDGNVPVDEDKEFSFTLTLESSTPLLANAYGNTTLNPTPSVEVENGTYTYTANFTLKHEDTITFTNIPAGTTYTVTEADYKADGYLTSNTVNDGYIATGKLADTDETVTVTYTNTRNVGDLQVSKTVAGNDGDEGKDFNFNLTLTNAAGLKLDGTYTVTGIEGMQSLVVTPGETTDDGTTTGTASFQLKDGDAITIYGIPAGTAYTVTEADYKAEGYVTEVSVNNQAAPKAEGTIPTDDEQQPLETVAFTNTRNVGNLTVTKTVTGEGADAPGVPTAFEVTVTLEAPTGVDLVGTVNDQDITQAEGFNSQTQTFSHTFTLADGASVEFTGLPENTVYEVTEADYTAEGFVTTYNTVGDVGNDKQIDANDEGECITVTVNNHRPAAGLTITKNIGGSGSSEDDEFTFKVSLTRTDDVLVDGEYNWTFNNPANEDAQTTTFNVKDGVGTVTLKGGQSVTIADIPVGTTYTVTELTESGADAEIGAIDTNGYTLTKVSGATGTIENEKGIYTATFENERYVGDLTVEKLVVGNAQSAPNALTEFDITVTLTAPTGVDLAGTVNDQPVQPTQTFTLEAGESVEFIGLPEGTTYVVTEADYTANGYAATFENASGTIVRRETGSVTATVTNTKYVGSLQVSKTTVGTGADQDKEFDFTLTLTGANGTNVNGTYDVTGIDQPTLTVENGAASFTLTHGQTITIDGIPAGTTYKVEETVPTAEGYEQPTMTGQTGIIAQEATAQASFINRRDVGNLTVTKIVAGNGEGSPNALTAFDITVELTAPAGVDLVGTVNSQPVQPTQTFTLADGQSVKFVGLPEGTEYNVSEADYSANGYETTYTAQTGTIEATLESAAGVISTVTNTLDTRSLSVSKIVSGSGAETDKAFTFQLTLVNNDLNVNGTYQVEGVEQQTLTVEGGRASFTLTGGQTITILGIPENTRYLVTENDYIADGYVTSEPDNAQGQLNGQNATVAFTNTRDVGELTIQKTVNGALGDANRDFEFTLTLVPGENGVPVDGTYDATLHTAAGSEATTVSVEDGVSEAILLSGGERLVIHELPAGASYIVREASYQSLGYDTSASGQTGTIPATGSMPVAGFTNTRNGGSLIIEKALAGNAPIDTDTFEFTVTLSHPDGVDLNGSYQTLVNGESGEPVEFVGGEATVQITGAGTLEILGILAETDYEVTENLPATSDYELISSEGETGAIPVDDAATASFTNERNVGSLTLSKAVAGNAAETDREFDFTVFMTDRYGRNLNGAYAMRGDAGSSVTFTNGYASISLYAGQSATIDGILEGTYYSVTEDDANTDGYVTTSSGTTGLIGTGTSTASFLNTRNVTEEFTSVTVYKAWNDEDDADGVRPESITVYLYADGEAVDSAVLTAAGGWSTVFDGLPVYSAAGEAITYRVIEVSTVDYFASYAYAASIVNITNTHNPDDFTPRTPDDPMLLTLIEDNIIPLGGNVNMNEGDCFN